MTPYDTPFDTLFDTQIDRIAVEDLYDIHIYKRDRNLS